MTSPSSTPASFFQDRFSRFSPEFHCYQTVKMHIQSLTVPLLAASLPLASAQLDYYAKKAGLLYFGAATDSPGQRERAGLEASYEQYDAILDDINEFGQTTPTNGQKVGVELVAQKSHASS